jgi:hypothetical protein
MLRFLRFHPDAELDYAIQNVGAGSLIIELPRADLSASQKFFRSFLPEVEAVRTSIVTPQLLCALAIAQTGIDPEHYYFHPNIALRCAGTIYKPYREGPDRMVNAEYGLFAIPLPVARFVTDNPGYAPATLYKNGFRILADWITGYAALYKQKNGNDPDPVTIALMVHGSTMKTASNPFKINYRGEFLPKFIKHYNAAHSLLINQPEQK